MSKKNAKVFAKMRIDGKMYYCDHESQEFIAADNPRDRIPYKEFAAGLRGVGGHQPESEKRQAIPVQSGVDEPESGSS